MEIKIAVLELTKALSLVQGVAQKKNAMPILSNVLLKTEENGLSLSATDLDVGIRITRSCEVCSAGAITVSVKALADIVKMLPGPEVTLKLTQNNRLEVKSGRTNAKLVAISASEFPGLPTTDGVEFKSVETKQFLEMVQKTIYSSSTDENRYSLTGVYFEPQASADSDVLMVSTDGHRLSLIRKRFTLSDFAQVEPVTLPRKGLNELVKLLESDIASHEQFSLGFCEQHAVVECKGAYISMRLISGKFPNYNQVIPRLADKIVRASRNDLLLSLKRVSVLASEKKQSVKVKIENKDLTVSCVNPETGEVMDDVPVEYSGPNIEISFNAKYMIDALSSIADNNVIIKFTDPLSPTLITGMSDSDHQCVIMPMRT